MTWKRSFLHHPISQLYRTLKIILQRYLCLHLLIYRILHRIYGFRCLIRHMKFCSRCSRFFSQSHCIALKRKALPEKEVLGEVAEWSIAAVLKTVVLRGTRGSNPCLSAEPTGQNRTVSGQKPTNQRFVGFFIAYKSCFQDNKRTIKDIVSLLNRYLFPTGQKR